MFVINDIYHKYLKYGDVYEDIKYWYRSLNFTDAIVFKKS